MEADHAPQLVALGNLVRARRLTLGLTQSGLGTMIGWTQERVSALENGRYGLPSVPHLANLADALGIALMDLVRTMGFGDTATSVDAAPSSGRTDVRRRCNELMQTMSCVNYHVVDAELQIKRIQQHSRRRAAISADMANTLRAMQLRLLARGLEGAVPDQTD